MENNLGKIFEREFRQSAINDELLIIRLKDSALSWSDSESKKVRFTSENPCDFIIFNTPFLYSLELKHTVNTSISIQKTKEEPNKMIKWHQIQSLSQMSLFKNSKCGFILSYYIEKEDREYTYFLSIKNFSTFLIETDKKSINRQDVIDYGGILIEQIKKKKYYKYKIKELLEKIK